MASDTAIVADGSQNLRMGYNLATAGVLSTYPSDDGPASIVPTNYREPLPPIVLAGYFKLLEASNGSLPPLDYFRSGPGAKIVKLSNISWAILLCVAAYTSLIRLTMSLPTAVLGTTVIGWMADIDTLYTEVSGSALLLVASLFTMRAVKTGSWLDYFLAGLAFGALALTKAIFFYIAILLGSWLFLLAIWRSRTHPANWSMAAKWLVVFALGFAIVVGPWMLRNYREFGSTQITQRGGLQIYARAVKDGMNWTEYVGAFYVWAPPPLRGAIGTLLGFDENDLKKGGALQRLNRSSDSDFANADAIAVDAGRPQDAIAYYNVAMAERTRLLRQVRVQGTPQDDIKADQLLVGEAVQMIKSDPLKHLAVTLPALWRGAPWIAPCLLAFIGFSVVRRRADWFSFALPASILIAVQALTTHNIPRFNIYADAVSIICVLFLLHVLFAGVPLRRGGADSLDSPASLLPANRSQT